MKQCLFPVLASAVALAVFALPLSGCYTLKQGGIMLGYLARAVPLESLGADGNADEEARAENERFVALVNDIRRFAVEELGLRETKNYTKFVNIDRDYLAAIVSASAKDSFRRHEWRFPIVGSVPYKGFFIADDARREAAKLKKKGLDVWVRPVDAFSTLGWFRDPLYSFMRDYAPHRLADLLIHELTHATVFIKGNVQFNEELAEFVGSEGARLYIEARYGSGQPATDPLATDQPDTGQPGNSELKAMEDADADSAAFVSFVQGLIAELEGVYESALPVERKLEEKARIIAEWKGRFDAEYETRFRSDGYRGFAGLDINNAYLELYRLYYAGGSELKAIYAEAGGDLRSFIAAAKTIKGKDDPVRQLRLQLAIRNEQ
jgi:predicted aminopeptidase